MRLRAAWLVPLAVGLVGAVGAARGASPEASPIPVRVGEHTGFGRLVFDFTQPASWTVTHHGEQVELRFDPADAIGHPSRLPRNVRSVTEGDGEMDLVVAPGALLRTMRVGTRLVLDVLDPPRGKPMPVTASIMPARPLDRHDAGPAAPVIAPSKPASIAKAVPTVAAPAVVAQAGVAPAVAAVPADTHPQPVSDQPAESGGPVALAVARAPTPDGATGAILLPFSISVGAAVVPRRGVALLVFDEARPLDLSALQGDPIFGGATVHLAPAATLVRLPLAAPAGIVLRHVAEGWLVVVEPAVPAVASVAVAPRQGRVTFAVADPGRVVSVADPESEDPLLVGTQHAAGQGVMIRRRAPQFVLLPTWQGVAIEPLSDRLALGVDKAGFVLSAAGAPVALTPLTEATAALASAAGLTRSFALPALPTEALARRLTRQIGVASAAAARSRGEQQRAVAASMIALGMGAEAEAVLRIAAEENPREASLPVHAGLAGIAALVADRPGDAGGIDDPRLPGSDEVTLWRAVREGELRTALPRAAVGFAATWPLILAYQPELQRRLLPLAAETMVKGAQTKAAAALLKARSGDPALSLARGMLAQANGQTDAALAVYDSLATGKDRLARARAAPRAIELRLAAHRITVAQAADAYAKLLDAWRGDDRELRLRERLAELRAQSGGARVALSLLRDTAAAFPDSRPEIQARMKRMFTSVMADPKTQELRPLEFVALIDENTGLLPGGSGGDALSAQLADRLVALDLPAQAEPLLTKLMQAAPTEVAKAGFGARLAALRLGQGDARGALAALAASKADGLSPALAESRTLTWAAATARTGGLDAAVAALSALGTPDADEARATLFEQARNWAAAEGALRDYVRKTVPDTGKLADSQQRSLLRLATAAERAGDDAMLDTLRSQDGGRMESGPVADMFRLLTAKSVAGIADLGRSGQEAALARALPADLKTIR